MEWGWYLFLDNLSENGKNPGIDDVPVNVVTDVVVYKHFQQLRIENQKSEMRRQVRVLAYSPEPNTAGCCRACCPAAFLWLSPLLYIGWQTTTITCSFIKDHIHRETQTEINIQMMTFDREPLIRRWRYSFPNPFPPVSHSSRNSPSRSPSSILTRTNPKKANPAHTKTITTQTQPSDVNARKKGRQHMPWFSHPLCSFFSLSHLAPRCSASLHPQGILSFLFPLFTLQLWVPQICIPFPLYYTVL